MTQHQVVEKEYRMQTKSTLAAVDNTPKSKFSLWEVRTHFDNVCKRSTQELRHDDAFDSK